MSKSLADYLAVEELAPNIYVSKYLPERMGNPMPIAFGGIALGVAVHAACLTVSTDFHLYSVLGHYHSPGSMTEKFTCTVEHTRDTRSFSTRRVRVTQIRPDGKVRTCMELSADFHVREQGGLTYSAPSVGKYPPADTLPTNEEHVAALRSKGDIDDDLAAFHAERYSPVGALFDIRGCPGSVAAQNLYGILKPRPTTQDHLPIGSRMSAEWIKMRGTLTTQWEQVAAFAFALDGGISHLPIVHSDIRLEDVAAVASLDFALRFMQQNVDFSQWHLHERTTSSGSKALTYGESRLWDEKGAMVASMTQQSILRVLEDPKPSL